MSNALSIDQALAALAHPVRRGIVDRLLQGELTVGELGAPYGLKKPTISRHLKVLEDARLIERSIAGRKHHCRLNPQGLIEVRTWLRQYEAFWTNQLDALEQFIQTDRRSTPDE